MAEDWIREATKEELGRMGSWYVWAYNHGKPLAFWPEDNAITLVPEDPSLRKHYTILQMGVTNDTKVCT